MILFGVIDPDGPLAHLVERRFCTPEASSSNLLGSTKFKQTHPEQGWVCLLKHSSKSHKVSDNSLPQNIYSRTIYILRHTLTTKILYIKLIDCRMPNVIKLDVVLGDKKGLLACSYFQVVKYVCALLSSVVFVVGLHLSFYDP